MAYLKISKTSGEANKIIRKSPNQSFQRTNKRGQIPIVEKRKEEKARIRENWGAEQIKRVRKKGWCQA
jgi:hypothetical protein